MKDTPKYLAIAEKLKHEIETGEYQPNDQLPKEFDLARSYMLVASRFVML